MGEGVSSSPPLEERIEVRRNLILFRVMQSPPLKRDGSFLPGENFH